MTQRYVREPEGPLAPPVKPNSQTPESDGELKFTIAGSRRNNTRPVRFASTLFLFLILWAVSYFVILIAGSVWAGGMTRSAFNDSSTFTKSSAYTNSDAASNAVQRAGIDFAKRYRSAIFFNTMGLSIILAVFFSYRGWNVLAHDNRIVPHESPSHNSTKPKDSAAQADRELAQMISAQTSLSQCFVAMLLVPIILLLGYFSVGGTYEQPEFSFAAYFLFLAGAVIWLVSTIAASVQIFHIRSRLFPDTLLLSWLFRLPIPVIGLEPILFTLRAARTHLKKQGIRVGIFGVKD